MSKIDLEELKKTSVEITEGLMSKQNNLENIEFDQPDNFQPILKLPQNVQRPNKISIDREDISSLQQNKKRVGFQKAQAQNNIAEQSSDITVSTSDFVTLGNYNIPKQTLFLLLALIIIGAVMWYMTGTETKNKDKDKRKKL